MPPVRRLTAILAADVVGYSRLMGLDEAGTAQALREHRSGADPLITQHGGRVVKTTGDGTLIEFGSVVGAVECALALQHLAAECNAAASDKRRMEWRIGVHLGDVLIEGDDILGDGVNIAARLEGIAEPGGICISEDAFRQVRGKVEVEFADLGEQSLKNIARPLRVYRLGWSSAKQPVSTPAPLPLPDKPSIAVLPFANMSGDPEQEHFADGMVEEIITALSRIRWLFVIARNSSFTYKGQAVDVKQVGRELGVRYVLEGSVRKAAGNRVRVNAQLIDAETGAHLWADRCDCTMADLLGLQDEITRWIANALGVELIAAEAARPAEHPDALDYILRGRAEGLKPPSRDSYVERISLFEHALALDRQSVEAQSRLAHSLVGRALDLRTDAATADLARAEGLIGEVLAASPRSAYAHLVKGQLLRAQNRWEEAIPEYETALALDHNSVRALHGLAQCKLFTGAIEETIPLEEQAIRLSPRDPVIGNRYGVIGTVHLLQSRADEAIVWLEKAAARFRERRSLAPTSPPPMP